MSNFFKRVSVLSVVFILLLATCSSPVQAAGSKYSTSRKTAASATYFDAGYYILCGLETDGNYLDEEDIARIDLSAGLVLIEDGSGFLFINDDITDFDWVDGSLTADGETLPYALEEDTLTVADDGDVLHFRKTELPAPSREEVRRGELQTESSVVIANGTADLFSAVDNNTIIMLEPGVYDLTEYLEFNDVAMWDWADYNDVNGFYDNGVFQQEVYDGYEIVIGNVHNMTIMSIDPDDPAEFIVSPRYADVLTFMGCSNIVLENIVMGHTDTGDCSGDVLEFVDCSEIEMNDLDLYGCGVYGVRMERCEDVALSRCDIHDCSDGCLWIYQSYGIDAKYCTFRNIPAYGTIIAELATLNLFSCKMKNIDGSVIAAYGEGTEVNMYFCKYDKVSKRALENSLSGETAEYVNIIDEDNVPKG